jgi:putative metallohydrolase (TIGR04338 family)
MKTPDPDQKAVYTAEDRLQRWLDHPGPVTVYGSTWDLEPEARFGQVTDVQTYVDKVLGHIGCARPVTVRERRGASCAEYSPGVIAIPSRRVGGQWAMREYIVLHELAHHLDPAIQVPALLRFGGAHGPSFRTTYLNLLSSLGRPTWAYLLRCAFADAGLSDQQTQTALI